MPILNMPCGAGDLRPPDPFNFKLTPNVVFNHYFMSQGAPLTFQTAADALGTVSQHVLSTSGLLASPERTAYLYNR
jgi:hypothetical protein